MGWKAVKGLSASVTEGAFPTNEFPFDQTS